MKVSGKRQITLPIDQCRSAGIEPGDECDSFVARDGHITIVKKREGAAFGILKGKKINKRVSEEESRDEGIAG
ncbi:AbrB/MazE/SpoVT family DNA-binding domain-containing protein [Pseudomaricurvus alkylphenolicus]|uniref:AbrB/MazE/SpoVT family DNA-binding domain-containing protein n=1 Tax=Pseudomaricurvus alkylphenolicus TaxID=1306991 RepID=UPI00142077CF|nr:AbrB/MazE/SpoVT family DNA-binding domain-containing protein [Pseudomaricurvus alkylphenolicus]NIB44359.1 AbrB/MazE/SpoVT family DNA-binding domain-containing protein [Pseudomaricurvus alkylphenolicus]